MPRPALVLILALTLPASAQEKKDQKKEPAPKVLYSVPLVAKPGTTQKLAMRGKGLTGVKDVKLAGVEASIKVLGAKAVAVPNNHPADRVGDSEVEIELDLPKDAKPGAVKLTAVGAGGESNAYVLLVRDALAVTDEKESNDGFNQAQVLALPAAVEGTIKGERDVDVFRIEGKKGDKIRIAVEAARFGSPLDAIVTIHDARRAVLDIVDDIPGAGHSDPELVLTLPADGAYFISVIDAHDLGGPNFGYRLVVRKE